MLFNNLFVT